ncbi:hypothetical protein BDQ17DRAFT_1351349 [Cyathus striatus]|nr:hypothetical protein BDQ17DRAFT_1351349 [Cyathus striatus]
MFPGVDRASALRYYILIGDVLLEQGEPKLALSIFDESHAEFAHLGDSIGEAECLLRIGDSRRRRGDTVTARIMWEQARQLYVLGHKTEEAFRCEQRLKTFDDKMGERRGLAMRWGEGMRMTPCSFIVV